MRRVAIVCGAGYVSGKEIMALELAEGLRARSYTMETVTTLWGNGDFAGRLTALEFPVHRLWLGFISATLTLDCLRMTGEQMGRWPQLLAGYRRFLRRAKPERIVHTNWQHLLLLSPFLRPKRDLFWLHELVPNRPQYRRALQFLDRRLQCFVPVSHAVARSLTDIGIAPNKIRVIHNGIKDPRMGAGSSEQGAGSVRIGIVGQVGDWKGHDDLLEAFALVAKSHPAAELHIFGRGPEDYERQLKHRAESLGVGDKITWHGFVSDRATIFQSIDICAVPSRFEEPFGLVATEAGFFGLPVVASRRGGLPEIVEDGVTGFLFEACQPKEIAARLDELLKNPELRNRLGEAARRRVTAKFSRERFVDDFTQLLEGS